MGVAAGRGVGAGKRLIFRCASRRDSRHFDPTAEKLQEVSPSVPGHDVPKFSFD